MKVYDLLNFFEKIAPLNLQESYDNAGLLVGSAAMEITGVLTCLDSTEEVLKEAKSKNCNVVLAHHPIIFGGLKRLTSSNYIQKTVEYAIKNDIAIIAMHTNLDNVMRHGVNERIGKKIGLENLQILQPKLDLDAEGSIGSGVIGKLATPMSGLAFLKHVKDSMKVNVIKYTQLGNDHIENVAVCGGSGGFLLNAAIRKGADIFITSDYKYHEFFDANGKIVIADIGHYESEQHTIDLLCELINDNFSNFAAQCTELTTNPVNYL